MIHITTYTIHMYNMPLAFSLLLLLFLPFFFFSFFFLLFPPSSSPATSHASSLCCYPHVLVVTTKRITPFFCWHAHQRTTMLRATHFTCFHYLIFPIELNPSFNHYEWRPSGGLKHAKQETRETTDFPLSLIPLSLTMSGGP